MSVITILKAGSKSECPSTGEQIIWYIHAVRNKKEQTADIHMLNLTKYALHKKTQKSV